MSVQDKSSNDSPKNWFTQIGSQGRKVGILNAGYGLEKVSYGLGLDEFKFVKLNRIPVQKVLKNSHVLAQCPYLIGGPIDLFHSFNLLPLNKDFVLSYETELPRFLDNPSSKSLDFGYEILQSDRCKGIYSLSEAGRNFARRRMLDRGLNDLANRIKVFRGGFDIGESDPHRRPTKGPIKACFVGGHMFHKGIEATVEALQILRDGGVEIELTVVGKTPTTTYAVPGVTFDEASLLNFFEEQEWITYYNYMSNSNVLELFRHSHLLLFPSIDESLGWVLVEAGLSGIPRLATNIYAFPELISHEVDGWMVKLPLNQDLRWSHLGKSSAKEAWFEAKESIVQNMVEILGRTVVTHERLIEMGLHARENMSELYGINKAKETLSGIYNAAIL